MILFALIIWEFFKTGLFSVGGGLATMPFLYDIGQRTEWFTEQEMANIIAIAESCPGPLGVNMTTYAGYLTAGTLGGIISTLALTAPALIVITAVASMLNRFRGNEAVDRIFYGLRPASTALIAAAEIGVARMALLHTGLYEKTGILTDLFNWKAILLAAVVYITLVKFRKHPIVYIGASALAGIIFSM